jgi:hypothetical protein
MPNQSDRNSSASKFDGLVAFYPSPPDGGPWGEERESTAQRLSELGLDAGAAGVLDSATEDGEDVCLGDESSSATVSEKHSAMTDDGDVADTEAEDKRMLLRLGANGF